MEAELTTSPSPQPPLWKDHAIYPFPSACASGESQMASLGKARALGEMNKKKKEHYWF